MNAKLPSVLTVLLAVPAASQVSFGDLEGFRREMSGIKVAVPQARPIAPAALHSGAGGDLGGVTVGRGLFGADFGVYRGEREIGEIDVSVVGGFAGAAREYSVCLGGRKVMKAVAGRGERGATVTSAVEDGEGVRVGSVDEIEEHGASRFVLRDASGAEVAASGWVTGHSFMMKGAAGSSSVESAHWLFDRYELKAEGVDSRLAMTALLMNNTALYRRAAQRNRELQGDRPRGRYDR